MTAPVPRGSQRWRRALNRARAEIKLTGLAVLARRDRRLQQQRPHVRLLDRLLRAPVAVSVLSAGLLDRGVGHQLRRGPRGGLGFRAALFSPSVRIRDRSARRAATGAPAPVDRRQHSDDLGGDGRVRRHHLGGQPRLGRREAAKLPETQAGLVHDAGRCRVAAACRPAAGQRDQRRRIGVVRHCAGAAPAG